MPRNFWDAEAHCVGLGGHLASLHSSSQANALLDLGPIADAWYAVASTSASYPQCPVLGRAFNSSVLSRFGLRFVCRIGLHDADSEAACDGSGFSWADGTASTGFASWATGEPNEYRSGMPHQHNCEQHASHDESPARPTSELVAEHIDCPHDSGPWLGARSVDDCAASCAGQHFVHTTHSDANCKCVTAHLPAGASISTSCTTNNHGHALYISNYDCPGRVCRQTDFTHSQGGRCLGAVDSRQTAEACCSEDGCTNGYVWSAPGPPCGGIEVTLGAGENVCEGYTAADWHATIDMAAYNRSEDVCEVLLSHCRATLSLS